MAPLFSKTSSKSRDIPLREVISASVVTIRPQDCLRTAKQLMARNDIRHLVVKEAGEVFGVVSERDLAMALVANKDVAETKLRISDYGLSIPYVVNVNESLSKVLAKMADNKYGSVVVEEDGKLKGIFTAVDALRILAQQVT